MGFSSNQLIDIALNVAGSLAAGGLWLVIFSQFRRRRESESVPEASNVPARLVVAHPKEDRKKAEFVNLREATDSPAPGAYRRNRAEVVRLAREMLQSGSTAERVKEVLPI